MEKRLRKIYLTDCNLLIAQDIWKARFWQDLWQDLCCN